MKDFEKVYEQAIEDKILPGYALLAGDKNGQYCGSLEQTKPLLTRNRQCSLLWRTRSAVALRGFDTAFST
jgi:hypothetical protein